VAGELSLSSLSPAQPRRERKRVGRGPGSGKGRYSGRGIKGQKSRAGSHAMRPGFEGGQMPAYMRMGKQRGATSKDAMPIGPFRTFTWSVNVRDLEGRFDAGAEVTPEALKAAGLIRNLKYDVKILGHGELSKKLTVSAHSFSRSAAEKIEAAGGTVTWLKPPRRPKPKAAGRTAGGAAGTESAEPSAAEESEA
jgi:large subunit ribosomal protein L15